MLDRNHHLCSTHVKETTLPPRIEPRPLASALRSGWDRSHIRSKNELSKQEMGPRVSKTNLIVLQPNLEDLGRWLRCHQVSKSTGFARRQSSQKMYNGVTDTIQTCVVLLSRSRAFLFRKWHDVCKLNRPGPRLHNTAVPSLIKPLYDLYKAMLQHRDLSPRIHNRQSYLVRARFLL
jgi:hypothetical protein